MRGMAVTWAFLRRDWLIARSYRINFVLRFLSTLLVLALFYFVGKLVDANSVEGKLGIHGSYFAFVVGGLLIGRMIHVCLSAFARRLREEQLTGTLEAVLVTPLNAWRAVLGMVSYELVDALVEVALILIFAVVVFGVSLDLGGRTVVTVLVAIPATVALLAGIGVSMAAVSVVFKNPEALMGLTATAVELLAGVYFAVQVLPQPLRGLADISPFTWAVDSARAGFVGGAVATWKIIGLVVLGLIVFPLGLWLFEKGVDRARRDGSLAQY